MKYIEKIVTLFSKNRTPSLNSQEELLIFIRDKKNIEKAVEGSMEKRLDLIHKVN